MLELLSGRKSQEGLLVKWALPLIKEMKFGEVLDPRLAIPCDINPLVRLAKVASACVGNSKKKQAYYCTGRRNSKQFKDRNQSMIEIFIMSISIRSKY
nr:serine/threonine-protein kinase-like protein ACR4 [Ipomoea batatas]